MLQKVNGDPLAGECPRCHAACGEQGLCMACLLRDGLEGDPIGEEGGTAASTPEEVSKEGAYDLPTIEGFEIISEIGHGGMGVVYLADQIKPIRRRVALKLIKPGMDTRQVIARFEAELQALAMMDHPNVAKVLGAGTSSSGRPYFVMDFVDGPRITDYCNNYHLTTQERLELFLKICRAIQHAHQKGIIHRDIKPSNILITQNDGAAVPKVIDFGIAKATGGQALTEKTLVTGIQQFLGTPAYTSPEQVEGGGDIDTRTDIYSLGVLLYELLTGKTPFDSANLLKSGWDNLRKTIRETEPQRPSTKLTTLAADELRLIAEQRCSEPPRLINAVRGDLDWIVMRCLEKDRARRYETCMGLASEIELHLNNEPIVARPPSNAYRLQKWVRRNSLLFGAGAAVIGALVVGLSVTSWSLMHEKHARQEALKAEKAARKAEQTSVEREQAAVEREKRAQLALDFFTGSQVLRKFLPSTRRNGVPRDDSRTQTFGNRGTTSFTEPFTFSHSPPGMAGMANQPNDSTGKSNPFLPSTSAATYNDLAGKFWQWLMPIPLTNSAGIVNPGWDSQPFDVMDGQRHDSPVIFLAGLFGNVERSCTIPRDKYLFAALINIESSSLDAEPFFGETADEQATIATYFADHIVDVFCEIDGVSVPDINSYRFPSPQISFSAPTPWIFGDLGGRGTSSGDGYYIMINPMQAGRHNLHFGGAFEFTMAADDFDLYAPIEMTYDIIVP